MKELLENCVEFLFRTVGGLFVLILLIVLVFLAAFWPRQWETEPLPWLGIIGQSVDASVVRQYGLPFDRGVLVERVVRNSPADFSNIAPGDFIVKFNNRVVFTEAQLRNVILEMDPGEKVWMTVYRDGSYYNVGMRLLARPTDQALPAEIVAFVPQAGQPGLPTAGSGPSLSSPTGTAPPITADASLPHPYRGVCSNCHLIVGQQQASQPSTQLVAALRQRQNGAGRPGGFPSNIAPPGVNSPLPGRQQPLFGQGLPGANPVVPLEEFTWRGIALESFNPANAGARGLPANATGVMVDDVLLGSAGDQAGVQAGDLIREVNGFAVYDVDSFANIVNVQQLTGGVLLINRQGKSMYLTVSAF